MNTRINRHGLQIAQPLHDLVVDEILPGTGIDADALWRGFAGIVRDLAPAQPRRCWRAATSCRRRSTPGTARTRPPFDAAAYRAFLLEIGYLLPEGEDFTVGTQNVDAEIATLAGPQLVVPVINARYALNAANARWGSLYDALYGTDVIPEDGGADARRATTRCAARASSPTRARSSTARHRSPRQPRRCHGLRGRRTAQLLRHARRRRGAPARPGAVRRLPRHGPTRRSGAAAQPRPAHRDPGRPRAPDRQATTPPASRTWCSNPR